MVETHLQALTAGRRPTESFIFALIKLRTHMLKNILMYPQESGVKAARVKSQVTSVHEEIKGQFIMTRLYFNIY